jgi:hypothetical protein
MSNQYQVAIDETVLERRTVNVEAETPQEAAWIAFIRWVENGECDSGPEVEVPERTYTIDGEEYEVEEDC